MSSEPTDAVRVDQAGGNFHTPSHLSDGAKHLLKRMLCTDPLKRATIAEIRKMPFFQEDLPRYLQPLPEMERYPTLPMDDLSTLLMINEGRADPKKLAEEKGLVWTEDLGIIDPDVVEALMEKISAFPAQAIWEELRAPGDNTVKVAYQLVRDHKRIMKDCEWMSLSLAVLTFSHVHCRGRGSKRHGGVPGLITTCLEHGHARESDLQLCDPRTDHAGIPD